MVKLMNFRPNQGRKNAVLWYKMNLFLTMSRLKSRYFNSKFKF